MELSLSLASMIMSFLCSFWLNEILIDFCNKRNIIDVPNLRSSHTKPTPVGGGLAIIVSFFLGCIPIFIMNNPEELNKPIIVFSAVSVISLISFLDDIIEVAILPRLFVHFVSASIAATVLLKLDMYLYQYLPLPLLWVMLTVTIVAFTNLYNFMDGIDGLIASGSIYLSLSCAYFLYLSDAHSYYIYTCFIIASTTLGFLVHNWHPAKIFLGDIGSITIGFIIVFLLLVLALKGYWLQSLILPMYYIFDSGVTLLYRLIKLEKIWLPHKKHFFQKAVLKNISHAEVVNKIIVCDIILFFIAVISYKADGLIYSFIFLLSAVLVAAFTAISLPVRLEFLDTRAIRKP